jgi:hypothetical protein
MVQKIMKAPNNRAEPDKDIPRYQTFPGRFIMGLRISSVTSL